MSEARGKTRKDHVRNKTIQEDAKVCQMSTFLRPKLLHWYGLLLLAAPTWLWGRCGRHNSPPASSVTDLVFRRSDGSHFSVDTVHPSLLRSSSLSSPGWYHLQSLSSYVVLVSPIDVSKPPESQIAYESLLLI